MFPNQTTGQVETGIKRVRYSHDAMIDHIIANPWLHQRDIAREFQRTEAWISQIFCSDSFKKRLEERKADLVDPAIVESIEKGFESICKLSQSVLMEKIETTRDPKLALATLTVAAKAMGFGAREAAPVQVNWFQQINQNSGGHVSLVRQNPNGTAAGATGQSSVVATVPPSSVSSQGNGLPAVVPLAAKGG